MTILEKRLGLSHRDWCSGAGAHDLAKMISRYWLRSGGKVTIQIEQASSKQGTIFQIRSDMVGGLPTGSAADKRGRVA